MQLKSDGGKCLREGILYLFFGVLTTAVNYGAYYVLTRAAGMGILWATAWSWAAAVLFAFVTNKVWVFQSLSWDAGRVCREAAAFAGCRAASGLLDVAVMWLFADCLGWSDMWVKLFSNGVIIVLNYVFSKLWIFRDGRKGD